MSEQLTPIFQQPGRIPEQSSAGHTAEADAAAPDAQQSGEAAALGNMPEVGQPGQDRWMVRTATRIADVAGRFAGRMAERRTVGQMTHEWAETGRNKVEHGRKIARDVGHSVMEEIKFDAGNVATGFKEVGQSFREMAGESKDAVKGFLGRRAAAAQERKAARKQQRLENQAYRMNARFDRRETRRETIEHSKESARRLGRGTLKAAETAGLIAVGSGILAAEAAHRTGKKAASKTRQAATTAANRVRVSYHTKRAASASQKYQKHMNAASAPEYQPKHAK